MRIILLYILFLAFSYEQRAFSESENLKTSESEKRLKAKNERLMVQSSKVLVQGSKLESQSHSQVFNFSDSQILYYENQIRLADSLYKNYLPQYNFEEVKAAMIFFDSVQLSTDSFFLKSEKLKTSESEKRLKAKDERLMIQSSKVLVQGSKFEAQSHSQVFNFSDSQILYYENQIRLADSLYKNYLPQYNFEEVKAAMIFFDSVQLSTDSFFLKSEKLKTSESKKRLKAKDERLMIQSSKALVQSLQPEAQSHSQVFNFSDSQIQKSVDCCPLSVDNPEDYEKIRFVALINLRLAELLNDNQFCNLSINKSKEALKYAKLTADTLLCAVLLKNIGHSHHFLNNRDSALFYYKKSLKICSHKDNCLDIYKCVAKILYEKGDKDTAYDMLRENLQKSEYKEVRCAYYVTLGMMLYEDMEYDSATIYLNKAINDTESADIMITAARCLNSISDSVGNLEQKNHYDNMIVELLTQKNNASVRKGEIQALFEKYDSREYEMRSTFDNIFYMMLFLMLSFVLFSIKYFIHRDKKRNLQSELSDFISKCNEQEVIISEKDRVIDEFKRQLNKESKDFDGFKNCSISRKILSDIYSLKKNHHKINNLSPLDEDELNALIDAANFYLDGCVRDLIDKHPQLKKDDMYCIYLSLLNIGEPTKAVLLGKSYNSIWKRMKKVRKITRNKHLYVSCESKQQIAEEIPYRRDSNGE